MKRAMCGLGLHRTESPVGYMTLGGLTSQSLGFFNYQACPVSLQLQQSLQFTAIMDQGQAQHQGKAGGG